MSTVNYIPGPNNEMVPEAYPDSSSRYPIVASTADTASYVINGAIESGSNTFLGTQIISGGLFVSGSYLGPIFVNSQAGPFFPVASTDIQYNNAAGVDQVPTFTDLGHGTMSLDDTGTCRLYSNSNNQGIIHKAKILSTVLYIPENIVSYVNVRRLTDTTAQYYVTTNADEKNGSNIVSFLTTFWNGDSGDDAYDNQIHYINKGQMGRGMANKLTLRMQDTQNIIRSSGLNLGISGSNKAINISEGTVWVGTIVKDLPEIKSDVGAHSLIFNYHSASNWYEIETTTASYTMYDDGTNLQILPSGGYNTVWVYRYITDTQSGSSAYILGPQSGSASQAQASSPPPTPAQLDGLSILVGRIIYLSGSNTPFSIESTFVSQFSTTGVTRHGDLSGLSNDDHKQYLLLSGRGTQSVEDNLNFNGALIISKSIIIGTGSLIPNSHLHIGETLNDYFQFDTQNYNSGALASADFVIENDLGTNTEYYLDIGINSSNYNDPRYGYASPNNSFIIAQTSSLVIGLMSPGQDDGIIFSVTGTGSEGHFIKLSPNRTMTINKSGSNANSTLDISGSVLITGSLSVTNGIIGLITSASLSQTSSYISQITALLSIVGTNIVSGSNQILVDLQGSNIFSSSAQLPSGTVSSSAQVLQGTNIVSGSNQILIDLQGSSIVSSSAQILTDIQGTNIVSSSAQILVDLQGSNIYSSSAQLPSGIISSSAQLPSGTVSSSAQILQGTNIVSSSVQVVADILNQQISPSGITSSLNGTASWALNSITASFVATSSWSINAITSSYVDYRNVDIKVQNISASSTLTNISLPIQNVINITASIDIHLPSITGDFSYTLKKSDTSSYQVNVISVSGQLIDGYQTQSLNAAGDALSIISNLSSNNWIII